VKKDWKTTEKWRKMTEMKKCAAFAWYYHDITKEITRPKNAQKTLKTYVHMLFMCQIWEKTHKQKNSHWKTRKNEWKRRKNGKIVILCDLAKWNVKSQWPRKKMNFENCMLIPQFPDSLRHCESKKYTYIVCAGSESENADRKTKKFEISWFYEILM
jgi:hypothetical protein